MLIAEAVGARAALDTKLHALYRQACDLTMRDLAARSRGDVPRRYISAISLGGLRPQEASIASSLGAEHSKLVRELGEEVCSVGVAVRGSRAAVRGVLPSHYIHRPSGCLLRQLPYAAGTPIGRARHRVDG